MHTDTGTTTSHSHSLSIGDCCRCFGCYCSCIVLFNSYNVSLFSFVSLIVCCAFFSLQLVLLLILLVVSVFLSHGVYYAQCECAVALLFSSHTHSLTHFPRFFSNSIRLILIIRMNGMNEAIKLNGLFNCVNCCGCCLFLSLFKIIENYLCVENFFTKLTQIKQSMTYRVRKNSNSKSKNNNDQWRNVFSLHFFPLLRCSAVCMVSIEKKTIWKRYTHEYVCALT